MTANRPSVEPHPGSASSEAAGDARTEVDPLERIIDDFLEDYEMVGEAPDGRDACHQPTAEERALIKDAIMGLLADSAWDAAWGRHIAALATPATQASTDRALFISGAAGPLGDPEILGAGARLLTDLELADAMRADYGPPAMARIDAVQHKFCEVNGIALRAASKPGGQ